MAELVTHVDTVRGRSDQRVRDMLARFGGGPLEARNVPRRDQEAIFAFFAAGKGRLPVRRVTRHVCRHDEGTGNCSQGLIEG